MTARKVGHQLTWQMAEFIGEVFARTPIRYSFIVDIHLQ